jgi:hypothetical protein
LKKASDQSEGDDRSPDRAFAEALNRQGFAFQESALASIQELRTKWTPWVSELPVGTPDQNTRIDFVLSHPNKEYFLVCECKRANPATSNWCFAKADFQAESSRKGRLYVETLERGHGYVTGTQDLGNVYDLYQIGIEVKSGGSGDAAGEGRGQIESAATQVMRGQNGLIKFFADRAMLKLGTQRMVFVPVILTTALLWTSRINLRYADLHSGRIDPADVTLEKKNWIWFLHKDRASNIHFLPVLRISVSAKSCSLNLRDLSRL